MLVLYSIGKIKSNENNFVSKLNNQFCLVFDNKKMYNIIYVPESIKKIINTNNNNIDIPPNKVKWNKINTKTFPIQFDKNDVINFKITYWKLSK
jgi:hypothetical protein